MNEQEKNYWNVFYSKFNLLESSDFAKFVINFIGNKSSLKILDCGCGNGRDSYYLALQNKNEVVGIDNSFKPENNENCKFIQDNFVTFNKENFDLIYSRFTMHSITNKDQVDFLNSIKNKDTILCIETRSDVDINESRYHGDTHYRNLTNYKYIINLLESLNFEIIYKQESKGLAIFKNENPTCIRIIAKKL
jgi:tellurite methyltransferase